MCLCAFFFINSLLHFSLLKAKKINKFMVKNSTVDNMSYLVLHTFFMNVLSRIFFLQNVGITRSPTVSEVSHEKWYYMQYTNVIIWIPPSKMGMFWGKGHLRLKMEVKSNCRVHLCPVWVCHPSKIAGFIIWYLFFPSLDFVLCFCCVF